MELVRTHRKAAVLLCALVTALGGLVIVLVLGQGSASWTGVEVTVPSCPASAQGCRLFVTHPDGTAVVHADWSGAGATIDVQLPPGSYLVSAEGCAGDQIGNVVSSVRRGHGDGDQPWFGVAARGLRGSHLPRIRRQGVRLTPGRYGQTGLSINAVRRSI